MDRGMQYMRLLHRDGEIGIAPCSWLLGLTFREIVEVDLMRSIDEFLQVEGDWNYHPSC